MYARPTHVTLLRDHRLVTRNSRVSALRTLYERRYYVILIKHSMVAT